MSLFTQKELAKFSVTKALSEIANQTNPGYHGPVTGLEREVHDTLAARLTDLTGAVPTGFLLPIACLKALNVTTATAGGFMVGTELAAIVPALRSKSVAIAMGATIFENLLGNCGVPGESTIQTAEWLAELEELSGSDSSYNQTNLTPRRCASMATVSQQLLTQNSLGVENFMRASLPWHVGNSA
jgi:HK97 family phage major capsid protein